MARAAEIRLEVGACGWEYAGWIDDYYPDSLPDDWRLTYYSNEFRRVLIPPDYWQRFGPDVAARWAEDVHADFRFLPELRLSADGGLPAAADLRRWCAPLAGAIAAVVLHLDAHAPPTAQGLSEALAQLDGIGPLVVDGPARSLESYEEVIVQAGARDCWRPGADRAFGDCPVGRLTPSEATADLRQLRALVEQFIEQAAPGDDLTLLFEGAPPSTQRMNDVAVILSLLS